MCYVGKHWWSKKVRTAKRGIKVYKICCQKDDGEVAPFFYSMTGIRYREGCTISNDLWVSNRYEKEVRVYIGLHSFNPWLTRIHKENDSGWVSISNINGLEIGGYVANQGKVVKVECHIPKGAKYLMDLTGELVSDKLVVDKIIEL